MALFGKLGRGKVSRVEAAEVRLDEPRLGWLGCERRGSLGMLRRGSEGLGGVRSAVAVVVCRNMLRLDGLGRGSRGDVSSVEAWHADGLAVVEGCGSLR